MMHYKISRRPDDNNIVVLNGKMYNLNYTSSFVRLAHDIYLNNYTVQIGDSFFPKKRSLFSFFSSLAQEYREFFKACIANFDIAIPQKHRYIREEQLKLQALVAERRIEHPGTKAIEPDINNLRWDPQNLYLDELESQLENALYETKYEWPNGLWSIPILGQCLQVISYITSSVTKLIDNTDELLANITNSDYELRIRRITASVVVHFCIVMFWIHYSYGALPIFLTVCALNLLSNNINRISSGERYNEKPLLAQIAEHLLDCLPRWIYRNKQYQGPMRLYIDTKTCEYEGNDEACGLMIVTAENRSVGISHFIYHLLQLFFFGIAEYIIPGVANMPDHNKRFKFCPDDPRRGNIKKECIRMCRTALSDHAGLMQIDSTRYNIRNKKDFTNLVNQLYGRFTIENHVDAVRFIEELPNYFEAVPEHYRAKSCKIVEFQPEFDGDNRHNVTKDNQLVVVTSMKDDTCKGYAIALRNRILAFSGGYSSSFTLPPVMASFSFKNNESIHNVNAHSFFTNRILRQNAGIVKIDKERYNISSPEGFNAFIEKVVKKASLNSRKIETSELELNTYEHAVPIRYR